MWPLRLWGRLKLLKWILKVTASGAKQAVQFVSELWAYVDLSSLSRQAHHFEPTVASSYRSDKPALGPISSMMFCPNDWASCLSDSLLKILERSSSNPSGSQGSPYSLRQERFAAHRCPSECQLSVLELAPLGLFVIGDAQQASLAVGLRLCHKRRL